MIVAAGLSILVWQQFPFGHYWLWVHRAAEPVPAGQLDLSQYRVVIDARPVEGVKRNLSDITYNESTGTLFAVINNPPAVAELSLDGRLLRKIAITGKMDPEGISHISGDMFVITDEHHHRIIGVRIDDSQISLDTGDWQFALDLGQKKNFSFEGVSWDAAGKRLIVGNEKHPVRVLSILGLLQAFEGNGALDIRVAELELPYTSSVFSADLSALTHHKPTGALLLLSDEAALVKAYRANSEPIPALPLWKGRHGLAKDIEQAEGLTFGPSEELYIVAEPNLLYVLEPAGRPPPS